MLRLQQRPITFLLPIIPTLQEQDFIKISHLNVRGYLDHIDDLKADHVISSADVICLTETHLCKLDIVHPNSQPTNHMYNTEQIELVVFKKEE